jgi:DNA-binding response OmpR family regulator
MSHATGASVAFHSLRQTNAMPEPDPACDDPEPRAPGEAPAGRVLVADAGEDHRASLGRSLQGWGYHVVLAGSGEEALRSCRRPAAGAAPLAPRIAASELGPVPAPRRHTLGPLTVDPEGYRAFVHGREILLSATEIRLLLHLFGSRGALCGRAALLTQVWGYHPGVSSRTVDVYVKRLRDKLGAAGYLVETVRGLGYRFVDRREPVAAAP